MPKKEMPRTEKEWEEKLTEEQYRVLRKKGTECAFTGEYWNNKKKGMYHCAACGTELFSADAKFDSGTGWPSFSDPKDKENIITKKDFSMIIPRTEVLCKKCGGHLGHLFKDGPTENKCRYCINSVSLEFREKKSKK